MRDETTLLSSDVSSSDDFVIALSTGKDEKPLEKKIDASDGFHKGQLIHSEL